MRKKRLEETVYKLIDRLLPKKQSDANQSNGFAHRSEQTGKTNFKLALKKNADCFVDGHGKYTSTLVTFKGEGVRTNFFLNPIEICKRQ